MALAIGFFWILPSCSNRNPRVLAANPDRLLGRWVCIADNVRAEPKTTMDLMPDGTAIFIDEGKKITARYRREPGKVWLNRRKAVLRLIFKAEKHVPLD